jgi:hypothetical protein
MYAIRFLIHCTGKYTEVLPESLASMEPLIEERFFPALLSKMNSTLHFARQRLQVRRSDSPLLFDLDRAI